MEVFWNMQMNDLQAGGLGLRDAPLGSYTTAWVRPLAEVKS
jgi:hypothetical protein